MIREMAAAGSIILWWPTENAELLERCARIHAFDTEGMDAGELQDTNFNEDGISVRQQTDAALRPKNQKVWDDNWQIYRVRKGEPLKAPLVQIHWRGP